jgi:predicted GNAT family acetyltransferase
MAENVNIERFNCPGSFLNYAAPYLETHEALNNLLLGVLVRLAEEHYEEKAFMATVQQDGAIALAGLYFQINLLLSHGDAAAIPALAEELLIGGWKIPGVLGPSDLVKSFASFWTGSRGCTSKLWVQQRILRLDQVQWTSGVPGTPRLAEAADVPLLVEWYRQFDEEIGKDHETMSPEEGLKNAEKRVLGRKTYFWVRNGAPVSMAAQARPTANGMAINGVFTPPGNRCQGYASALVAAVSQMNLDAGKKFCTLYTDTDNPTSNSIYQKIGYKPVGDATVYRFEYPDLH